MAIGVFSPTLTVEQKQNRVEWAKKHQNDDWNRTIFTDEFFFQLFRDTFRRRSKNPEIEVKRIPKNRQKVHIWGAIILLVIIRLGQILMVFILSISFTRCHNTI